MTATQLGTAQLGETGLELSDEDLAEIEGGFR
jgi:bacteriocin-like protein